jgi:hypothetical protein
MYYCMVKIEKTCLLIDMAAPDDSNVDTEDTEKLSNIQLLSDSLSNSVLNAHKYYAPTLNVQSPCICTPLV